MTSPGKVNMDQMCAAEERLNLAHTDGSVIEKREN
jgi:hypothetical protein